MKFGIAGNLDKTELPEVVERLIARFTKEKVPYVLHEAIAKGLRGKMARSFLSQTSSEPVTGGFRTEASWRM